LLTFRGSDYGGGGGGQGATISLVILVEKGQMYNFVPNEKELPLPPKNEVKFQNYRLLLDNLNFLWVNFNLFQFLLLLYLDKMVIPSFLSRILG